MKRSALNAIFLIAACAISTGAWGQKVFRCGSSYSHIPCNGAVTIEPQDTRSKTQKTQSDQSTVRDLATANTMENDRKRVEAKTIAHSNAVLNAGQATESTAKGDASEGKPEANKKKAKKKEVPGFFTAQGEAPQKAVVLAPAK